MAIPTNQQYQRAGSFVQTTQVWDQAQLANINVNSEEFKKLLVRLYQNINQIAVILNTKETGAYYQQEFVTGSLLFPNPADTLSSTLPVVPVNRQISRIVVNFGALPNATTKSVPHNLIIGPQWTFIKISGCATNPGTSFIPIPYSSSNAADIIELNADMTNVNITTASDKTAYTTTYVILEFVTL